MTYQKNENGYDEQIANGEFQLQQGIMESKDLYS